MLISVVRNYCKTANVLLTCNFDNLTKHYYEFFTNTLTSRHWFFSNMDNISESDAIFLNDVLNNDGNNTFDHRFSITLPGEPRREISLIATLRHIQHLINTDKVEQSLGERAILRWLEFRSSPAPHRLLFPDLSSGQEIPQKIWMYTYGKS